MSQAGRTFVALNVMRGAAAVAVALYHAGSLLDVNLVPSGYLAVDFFFALSGFVIAHAYGDRVGSNITAWRFFLLRLARFYPLYIMGTSLAFAVLLAGNVAGHSSISIVVLISLFSIALLFIPNPNIGGFGDLFPLNVPAWSLFFELVINVVYALVNRWLRTPILAVVVFLGAGSLIWVTLNYGSGREGFTWPTFHVGLIRVTFSFFLGVLLYRLRHHLKISRHVPAWLAIALLVSLLVANPNEELRAAYDVVFVVALSPLLVALGAMRDLPSRWEWVAAYAGVASFVVYAMHMPAFLVVRALGAATGLPLTVLTGAALVSLIALSGALNATYDAPLRRALLRVMKEPGKSRA